MTAGVSTIGISDHNLIYAVRKHSSVKSKPITIQCRNYKGFNENNFKRDIESVPWHFVGSYDDPIKAWESWKKFFLQIADMHAPISLCPRPHRVWSGAQASAYQKEKSTKNQCSLAYC